MIGLKGGPIDGDGGFWQGRSGVSENSVPVKECLELEGSPTNQGPMGMILSGLSSKQKLPASRNIYPQPERSLRQIVRKVAREPPRRMTDFDLSTHQDSTLSEVFTSESVGVVFVRKQCPSAPAARRSRNRYRRT